jgi:hypothetical protein
MVSARTHEVAERAARAGFALLLLLAVSPALADDSAGLLDKAQQAIDDIDYEAAKKLATQAIESGKLEGKALHRAYRLAGESAAALGDNKTAKDQFLRWVILDPKAELPAGSSPKIGLPFSEARAEADKLGRFAVDVAVNRQKDKVEIVLSAHDPLSMVAGMRLQLGDATIVSVTGNRAVLPAADAASVSVAVAVVDARGNELSRRTVTGSGGETTNNGGGTGGSGSGGGSDFTTRVEPTTRGGWPTIIRWPVWTGVAVVAAGASGFFAYQVGQTEDELAALNAMSDLHSFDEAESVRERGERQAMFANIGLGVAGAAAVAAVLTFVLEPDTVEIQPAPTAGGATIGASIRF